MKKYYADKNSLNFLRVAVFLLLIGIIFGLKYLLSYLQNRYPDYFIINTTNIPEIVIWSIMAALAIAYVLFILIILPLWYNSLCYIISSDEIVLRSGVFNKSRQYMKMSAVQYTTVLSMPFSKYTSFNFLVISAHGGRLVFMFLSSRDADEMASRIQKSVKSKW